MSDNLDNNIKQLAELLSQEDVADNLKKLLTGLLSSKSGQDEKPKEQETKNTQNDRSSANNLRMLENIVRAVSDLRETSDPGVNLLMSLKPFLRQTRNKTLDDCVKILHMARIYDYMHDHEEISN